MKAMIMIALLLGATTAHAGNDSQSKCSKAVKMDRNANTNPKSRPAQTSSNSVGEVYGTR